MFIVYLYADDVCIERLLLANKHFIRYDQTSIGWQAKSRNHKIRKTIACRYFSFVPIQFFISMYRFVDFFTFFREYSLAFRYQNNSRFTRNAAIMGLIEIIEKIECLLCCPIFVANLMSVVRCFVNANIFISKSNSNSIHDQIMLHRMKMIIILYMKHGTFALFTIYMYR